MIASLLNRICRSSHSCNLSFIPDSVEKFALSGVVFPGYFKYHLKKSNFIGIAKAASQLVNPGESVVINCGSTAFLLGREMCGKPVQIITNYLPLANYLIDQEHDSVIIMGGQYNKSQSITLSPQGSENSLYAGHWMFTSGKGLTAEGLYKTDMLTAMAEQKMLSVVGKLVVLVDSSKIGERAGMLFSRADQIDMLITGKNANPEILQQLEAQGVSILRV